jgi:hypothetical protein
MFFEGIRHARRFLFNHTQVRVQRLATIHILVISPAPGERLGVLPRFQTIQIDAIETLQNGAVFPGPIATHGRHHAHRRMKRRGRSEIRTRAAQDFVSPARGRFNRIDTNGSGDDQ